MRLSTSVASSWLAASTGATLSMRISCDSGVPVRLPRSSVAQIVTVRLTESSAPRAGARYDQPPSPRWSARLQVSSPGAGTSCRQTVTALTLPASAAVP